MMLSNPASENNPLRCKQSMGGVLRQLNLKCFVNESHPTLSVSLRALLTPILCYGCEIWGFKEDKDLERVEIKFLKSILRLPNSTPNMAVRSELGKLPIHLWWKEREVLEQTMLSR